MSRLPVDLSTSHSCFIYTHPSVNLPPSCSPLLNAFGTNQSRSSSKFFYQFFLPSLQLFIIFFANAEQKVWRELNATDKIYLYISLLASSSGEKIASAFFSSVTQSCPTLCDPWTAAGQASLSITNSWSPPKPRSIELVMPSNHLILYHPLLLLPSIFPSIRVFSNESALHIRWPKYWCFNFRISPSIEHTGLISFRMDWLYLLAVQGTLQESSPTPQYKNINSLAVSFLYSPTLTSIHDHWKNHSLD